eukprot:TRINITY_DN77136_c0_g1_i1.p1 TRINITY_DN77136_c0_g1~~TRINITY_DN77136_c0_g1_i1.p1  ORF type:complete len:186 (+),score=57.65 TRINITY_DN77136_c0_g1_i1:68-625(+)
MPGMFSLRHVFAVASALGAAHAVSLLRSRTDTRQDECGKGFENLNPGSQKYFNSLAQLWNHPGRKEQFGIFESELQCWFTHMVTTKCDGLPSQAAARKEALTKQCMDVTVNYMPIWKHFNDAEVRWFKQTYPNDEEDHFAAAGYREKANTALELNKKEMLCMTLFTVDDNCVDSMYMRTTGIQAP